MPRTAILIVVALVGTACASTPVAVKGHDGEQRPDAKKQGRRVSPDEFLAGCIPNVNESLWFNTLLTNWKEASAAVDNADIPAEEKAQLQEAYLGTLGEELKQGPPRIFVRPPKPTPEEIAIQRRLREKHKAGESLETKAQLQDADMERLREKLEEIAIEREKLERLREKAGKSWLDLQLESLFPDEEERRLVKLGIPLPRSLGGADPEIVEKLAREYCDKKLVEALRTTHEQRGFLLPTTHEVEASCRVNVRDAMRLRDDVVFQKTATRLQRRFLAEVQGVPGQDRERFLYAYCKARVIDYIEGF